MLSGIVKRQFSTAFLEVVEPILEENRGLYRFETAHGQMLRIVDSDPQSDYFYSISKEEWNTGSVYVTYDKKPLSPHEAKSGSGTCKLAQFPETIKSWLSLVRRHQQQSILDDARLWGYEQEFHQEFRLADDDADTSTFSFEQQLLLDRYFEVVVEELEGMRNEKNDSLIEELKSEAKAARDVLTTETKNGVMKRMGRLWAKSRLAGIEYSKWMVKTFMEGVVRAGGGEAFNWVSDNLNRLPNLIETAKGLIERNAGG